MSRDAIHKKMLADSPFNRLNDAEHQRHWTKGWRDSLARHGGGYLADERMRLSAAQRAWRHGWNSAVKHGAEWLRTHDAATESGSAAYDEYSVRGRQLRREG